MAKLNQIIAVEKGVKTRTYSAITSINKEAQKPDLFHGFVKKYRPQNEMGETLPSEHKQVQKTFRHSISEFQKNMSELMQITARKDWSNTQAFGDIVLDGKIILEKVPVSYLLFLEKQLTDLKTFVGNLPTLDTGEIWTFDENQGIYQSSTTSTHRTKKVQKPIVLYDATEHHPAQTQLITEDVIVGFWDQSKQSGACPAPVKAKYLANIERLIDAIKEAREAANSIEETSVPNVGALLFDAIF